MDVQQLARALLVLGLAIAASGLLLLLIARIGGFPRLPGDLVVQRPGFTLYLPLGTSVVLSLLLTLILPAAAHWWRR